LPVEFPKEIINKVFCIDVETCGFTIYDSKPNCNYKNKFKAKIYISEDEGIYVEYNYREKFGENFFGTTQKVINFPLLRKDEEAVRDKYDDIVVKRTNYEYKVYGNENSEHRISKITFSSGEGRDYFGQEIQYSLKLFIRVPEHSKGEITISPNKLHTICGKLKTKFEIEKEERERINLENQKKEADKSTLQKINDLLSKNGLEDAAKEYNKLNFVNSEIKEILQQKLDDKFGGEIIQLNFYNVEDYVKSNKTRLKSLNPGKYSISFDKLGNPSNLNFPNWPNVPNIEFSSFSVKLNSQTEIEVLLKDSILVSSAYSTSNEKPLYIDKNEKFYFKTKTGLPVTTTSYNQAVDKKLVRINKVYKREKYANGILIDSQEFKTEKTVGILKKDQ
jgi:hypothetical protein